MAKRNAEASGQDGLTERASEKVQEATSVAQEKTSELREQSSSRLRDELDQRSTQVGSQMRSLGEALRRSGSDLSAEGNPSAAQFIGQVADRLERFGGSLEQKSGDDFLRDVEGFTRRRPWMLAGLGLLAGVAAARFVKASSEGRYGHTKGRASRNTRHRSWAQGQKAASTRPRRFQARAGCLHLHADTRRSPS